MAGLRRPAKMAHKRPAGPFGGEPATFAARERCGDMIETPEAHRVALVLAGGNALGAYQAGVYQALHEHGIEPHWIVGTSIGAINGAVIAGNAPERRLSALAELWRPAGPRQGWPDWWAFLPDGWRRTVEVASTMLSGRPGVFAPLGSTFGAAGHRHHAIYDTHPLLTTLSALVDFERLNEGPVRYAAMAVDLDSGQDAVFDSKDQVIAADHVRASAAFPPAFPAVPIDGRMFVDGGLSANLPLDPVLSAPGGTPLLCIAVDLLPIDAVRPRSLGEMIGRTQDLVFGIQSRRSIERWRSAYQAGGTHAAHSVALVRLAYADQGCEVAGKAMDFSPESVRRRWDVGRRDGAAVAEMVADGRITSGAPGLETSDHPVRS